MRPERLSDISPDDSIRSAFEPPTAGVHRVTRAALAARDGVSVRRKAHLPAVFAGAVVVCLFVTSILLLPGSSPTPAVPAKPSPQHGVIISNSEGVVTATTADGQLIVIVSGGVQ